MAKKARKGASASAADIPLRQPDRSGPSEETLRQLAGQRSLFEQAAARQQELDRARGKRVGEGEGEGEKEKEKEDNDDTDDTDDDDEEARLSPRAERILDTLLWSVSLAMLHFTLDVLVQNQYAQAIDWREVAARAALALGVFAVLVDGLHRHASDPRLRLLGLLGLRAPSRWCRWCRLSLRAQDRLRQVLFCATSTVAGCYLVHITDRYSYLAVMQRAPPLGCLWVWSVIELDLPGALASLAVVGVFLKLQGYGL